jgi:CO dehydrogenase/acetyl-CoA synthase epsilon subunit
MMFPYKQISDEDVNQRFDNLRDMIPHFENMSYTFKNIDIDPIYCNECDLIFDNVSKKKNIN